MSISYSHFTFLKVWRNLLPVVRLSAQSADTNRNVGFTMFFRPHRPMGAEVCLQRIMHCLINVSYLLYS